MQNLLKRKGFQKDFQRRNEQGLSLLEIVIAVAIIAIFAALGILAFQKLTDNARQTAVEAAAMQLYTAGHVEKVFKEDDLDAMTASWSARSEGLTATAVDAGSDFCITVENEKYGNTASRGYCTATAGGDNNAGDNTDNAGDENAGDENADTYNGVVKVAVRLKSDVPRSQYFDGEVIVIVSGSAADLRNGFGTVEIDTSSLVSLVPLISQAVMMNFVEEGIIAHENTIMERIGERIAADGSLSDADLIEVFDFDFEIMGLGKISPVEPELR